MGQGPRLLTSSSVLSMADLGSPQPQVSVSALSSKPQWRQVGVGRAAPRLLLWWRLGRGQREALLPFQEQLIQGVLEPPAGVVGACPGRWDVSGSLRHDRMPPNMPPGSVGLRGGGRAGRGCRGAFGGCLGDG